MNREEIEAFAARVRTAYETSPNAYHQDLVTEFEAFDDKSKIGAWSSITAMAFEECVGDKLSPYALFAHQHFVDGVLAVFKVPRGQAGVGVEPQIPSWMKVAGQP